MIATLSGCGENAKDCGGRWDNIFGREECAVPQPTSQNVSKTSQTISNLALPNPFTVGQSHTLAATSSSGLAVTYSSKTADICSVTDAQVKALKVGVCTVDASQAGDDKTLAAASVSVSTEIKIKIESVTTEKIPQGIELKQQYEVEWQGIRSELEADITAYLVAPQGSATTFNIISDATRTSGDKSDLVGQTFYRFDSDAGDVLQFVYILGGVKEIYELHPEDQSIKLAYKNSGSDVEAKFMPKQGIFYALVKR